MIEDPELREIHSLVQTLVSNMRTVAYDDEKVFLTLFTMGVLGLFNEMDEHPGAVRATLKELIDIHYRDKEQK